MHSAGHFSRESGDSVRRCFRPLSAIATHPARRILVFSNDRYHPKQISRSYQRLGSRDSTLPPTSLLESGTHPSIDSANWPVKVSRSGKRADGSGPKILVDGRNGILAFTADVDVQTMSVKCNGGSTLPVLPVDSRGR